MFHSSPCFIICALLLPAMVQLIVLPNDMLLFWKLYNAKKCEPFTAFIVKCNKCYCGADGSTYCTRNSKCEYEPWPYTKDKSDEDAQGHHSNMIQMLQ